jgi:hypothetical protein
MEKSHFVLYSKDATQETIFIINLVVMQKLPNIATLK